MCVCVTGVVLGVSDLLAYLSTLVIKNHTSGLVYLFFFIFLVQIAATESLQQSKRRYA